MRTAIILVFCFATFTSFGQKVKPVWNEETNEVTLEGKYYIILKKMNGGNLGLSKNYSVQNKEGDELIFMKFTPRTNSEDETSYWYRMTFPESGSWFWLSKSIAGMGTKGAMKLLMKNELIKDGNLDWKKAQQYIQRHNGRIGYPKAKAPSESSVTVVDNDIFRDDVLIGKVLERHTETDRVYHVYDKSGSKVMVATLPQVNPLEWELTSIKGDTYNVLYEGEKDGIRILTYLAKKGWLK